MSKNLNHIHFIFIIVRGTKVALESYSSKQNLSEVFENITAPLPETLGVKDSQKATFTYFF